VSQRTRFLANARNDKKKRFALFLDNRVETNNLFIMRQAQIKEISACPIDRRKRGGKPLNQEKGCYEQD
jgi:hypothetical protein